MAEPQTGYRSIDWRRIVVESLAVVLSILLAFGIDAWWDTYREASREQELLAGLLSDFRASRPGLDSRRDLAERMSVGTSLFRDLAEASAGARAVEVPDSLILAALGGPTYEPDTNTLDAALASGELELIRSAELRAELATWRRTLADNLEDEREVRRLTNEQLAPELAHSLSLGPYFDGLLAWSGGDPYAAGRLIVERDGPGPTPGSVSLVLSKEVVGLLATRKFYVEFTAANLTELLASLDRLTALIERELR
jgi:hypothetical protein